MDKLEAFKSIAAEAGRGELIFPANVNATLKLQQALDDPDFHLDAAAVMVTAEPLLSARTVAIANSVAYNRSGDEITSVKVAVSRVGFHALRSMVAASIVRQLGSKVTDSTLRAMTGRLWEHTA